MRKLLWLVCLAFAFGSTGCFLDDIRRDDNRLVKHGGSARARQIENNVDWGTLH